MRFLWLEGDDTISQYQIGKIKNQYTSSIKSHSEIFKTGRRWHSITVPNWEDKKSVHLKYKIPQWDLAPSIGVSWYDRWDMILTVGCTSHAAKKPLSQLSYNYRGRVPSEGKCSKKKAATIRWLDGSDAFISLPKIAKLPRFLWANDSWHLVILRSKTCRDVSQAIRMLITCCVNFLKNKYWANPTSVYF